jgi:O-antigen chain-terminating methyltransferase
MSESPGKKNLDSLTSTNLSNPSDFYIAFENRYRGSRELIKQRQTSYLPYISPLKTVYPNLKAIDLGCGRGEWLELLKENGVDASGVDLDDAMLSSCIASNLNVKKIDAISALQELPNASLQIISGFHIAEHLPFEQLIELIHQALRVLSPGGLLILETPNSENIQVATSSFYLDPTHRNPIPAQLLSFLMTYSGFAFTTELRLNADISPAEDVWLTLRNVLTGVSRDYAIIAQKAHKDLALNLPIQMTSNNLGLSFEDLVGPFDSQLLNMDSKIRELLHVQKMVTDWREITLKQQSQLLEQQSQLLEQQSQLRDNKLRIHRLETPFRAINNVWKKFKQIKFKITQKIIPKINQKKIQAHQLTRSTLILIIRKLGLYEQAFAFKHRRINRIKLENLSPRAKQIYDDLKLSKKINSKQEKS